MADDDPQPTPPIGGGPSRRPAAAAGGAAGRRRRLAVVAVLVAAVLVAGVGFSLARGSGDDGPVAEAWTIEPHEGLAVWVDAYDWSTTLGGTDPPVDEGDIAAMADLGIQTVYLQTSFLDGTGQVVPEKRRLESLVRAAHHHGMSVVGWYLPTLDDVDADLDHLLASADLDIDGLAVDIESTTVKDPAERNARLLELNRRLRDALPDRVIGAITPSAVHLQTVNPDYWPDFPWAEVADTYDLIIPMTYWTIRLPEWRDGNRYVGENIDRIHAAVGDPDYPLHVVGGIADEATVEQVQGMLDAIDARTGVIGASLYDWATSNPQQWAVLSPLRALNPGGAAGT